MLNALSLLLALLFWPLTLARLTWSLTRWLFPYSFAGISSPKTPSSPVSLSTLSDDSLLTIFANLPVADLLAASRLCTHLHHLASYTARHRQSLILTDGGWSISHLTYTFPPSLRQKYLSPASGISPEHPAILRLTSPTPDPLLGDLATQLPVLLPNISRLYVSVQGDGTILRVLASIVGAWSSRLTRLHFRYQMADPTVQPSAEEKTTVRAHYESLLAAINSFSATFRHLHLNITTSDTFAYRPILTIHLPIIAQLSSLYLCTNKLGYHSQGDHSERYGLLYRYLPPGNRSRKLAIAPFYKLATLLQVPTHLASCLVKLDLHETLTEGSIANFALMCRRLGTNDGGVLRDLRVSFRLPLHQLVQAMAPLSKLTHLHLSSMRTQEPEMPLPRTALQQIGSVRSLSLSHVFERHAYLEQLILALGDHFPGVSVAALSNIGIHCADCDHGWPWGNAEGFPNFQAGFDPQVAAHCASVGQAYLRRHLPALQTLLSFPRLSWRPMEAPLNVQRAPWN